MPDTCRPDSGLGIRKGDGEHEGTRQGKASWCSGTAGYVPEASHEHAQLLVILHLCSDILHLGRHAADAADAGGGGIGGGGSGDDGPALQVSRSPAVRRGCTAALNAASATPAAAATSSSEPLTGSLYW